MLEKSTESTETTLKPHQAPDG